MEKRIRSVRFNVMINSLNLTLNEKAVRMTEYLYTYGKKVHSIVGFVMYFAFFFSSCRQFGG
jgi:hypothetical protein